MATVLFSINTTLRMLCLTVYDIFVGTPEPILRSALSSISQEVVFISLNSEIFSHIST